MADATVADLNERFTAGDKELEPDVVALLRSIMRMHELSPQDLFFKWESYCIKMDTDEMQPSIERLRDFKQDLQHALENNIRSQAHIKPERRIRATPRTAVKNGDVFGMLDSLVPSTPGTAKLNKNSAKRRQLETPSVSRIKAEPASSSPDYKTPSGLEHQLNSLGALP